MRLLLLDTDRATVRTLEPELPGYELVAAHSQTEGLRLLTQGAWDLVLLDSEFAGDGLDLLGRIKQTNSVAAPIVLLTREPTFDFAVEAIGRGAHDVLIKPPPAGRVGEILSSLTGDRAVRPLRPISAAEQIIGTSFEMMTVFKSIARAALSDATVLVLGESGTGKEMIAQVVHNKSPRSKGPFVAINCAAIPENLLESELFGHEKGAFTGAIGRRIGRFERANGGTLFLDEIGDMSLALQAKILRALQEREIERVGGSAQVAIDVRVIAATNRDLAAAVREEKFREDLFYRLAVVTLRLPALRQRGQDLDLLAEHFIGLYVRQHGRPVRAVAEEVYEVLRAHPWPGNVRQLRNALERAVVMSSGETLLPQHLPTDVLTPEAPIRHADDAMAGPLCTLAEMERRMIRRALRETGNNMSLAAHRLGIHRNTLRRKVEEYDLVPRGPAALF